MTVEIDLLRLRQSVAAGQLLWRQHGLTRMVERGITRKEVVAVLLRGEPIEFYGHDKPYPSCLLHLAEGEPLHVVAAFDPDPPRCHIITAYRPDLDHFEDDLKMRRIKR
ncbi:MAG: DUF4258 domain-containing protein [Gammaproteobacteria bacterium]|nr:DUF4258 domain-containing protein [Gammaproteobacteria bacterium]MBU1655378.1 DUF4258 domain-containing protein [Gammaproteobacteria bacterium]MBU1960356.1 DUF4258 domain-containing protein [Gammaproteobacteria bacterium]